MTSLSPERWQEIDRAFEEALARPAAERAAWLEATYAHDTHLVRHVHSLLASARESEAVLGESVSQYAHDVVAQVRHELAMETESLPLDGQVGPYRLVREIGRGGMGTVYLAERADTEFEKRVALKLVRRGMDTDEVLLRFRHERQILASLEHPYIARLYDGGAAADGRPFLVMEYVEGQPLSSYADERRLATEQRLRLFVAICEAVSFAHQNLVVHRDIKPSNILVTTDGTPKLLDFGIARLLDPAAEDSGPRTRTGLHLLTPEYASPEQRTGRAITTATDVYSLGLVLYELLTGRRPDAGGIERPSTAVLRSADADAAQRRGSTPARLSRMLRGDLDTIVLRALAEDPARRYATAEQLGADIGRHLGGLPVIARGDSLKYRAGRFVQRHRGAVLAAALVLLSLTGGLAASLWQGNRAARERDQAQLERLRAEEVTGFVLGLFEAADPLGDTGGDTLRVRALVDRGAQRVRTDLAEQPQLQAQLMTTLANVYMNLGLYDAGGALLDEALAIASARGFARERTNALSELADLARRRTDLAALDSLSAIIVTFYDSADWEPDAVYLDALSQRAQALEQQGDVATARALHERALELGRGMAEARGVHYSRLLNNLAVHHHTLGEYAEAEPLLRESLEIDRRTRGARHADNAGTLNNLASAVHYQGRHAEAEAMYREAIDIAREAYGADHPYVGQFTENLATLFDDMRRPAEAQPLYQEALRIATAAHGPDGVRTAMLKRNYALNRYDAADYAQAEALLRGATASLAANLGADHVYTALAEAALGRVLVARGRGEDALPLLRGALAVLEETFPPGNSRLYDVSGDIGAALALVGRTDEAEPMLIDAYESLTRLKGRDDLSTRRMRTHLHRFYSAAGQPGRAAEFATDL